MYRVIRYFTDLTDKNRAYNAGDIYPRQGLTVSVDRLVELSTDKNKRGVPLIVEVEEAKKVIKEEEPKAEPKETKAEPKAEEKPKKKTTRKK